VITPDAPDRQYSTRLRTALVITGTGTAGAYHAGVLRALHEAGVRIDLVAGRGIGALGAMFAAVDGGQRLWGSEGLWKHDAIRGAYGWRTPLRIAGWALVAACALMAVPLVLLAIGVIVAALGALLWLVNLTGISTAFTAAYARSIDALFTPTALPTVIPRLVVFAVLVAIGSLAASLATAMVRTPLRRRVRHGGIWRLVGAPLSTVAVIDQASVELWNLIRGAAPIAAPSRAELGRKYVELLAENVGQPGFREVMLLAHDMDARRDVVFALLDETHRARFFARPVLDGSRQAEAFDLAGVGREHMFDALAASLTIPVATDPHLVRFPAEGPWRGETHRLCDRPGSLERLLEEVAVAGAEQVIVLSAAPPPARPHELSSGRADLRGRAGEQLGAFDAAALRDAMEHSAGRFAGLFLIRPAHNPLGPLDFGGTYDERSDRPYFLAELIDRGYEDAYRQFIDPVIAASGDRIERVQS
jgi:patatin-like phospholipase